MILHTRFTTAPFKLWWLSVLLLEKVLNLIPFIYIYITLTLPDSLLDIPDEINSSPELVLVFTSNFTKPKWNPLTKHILEIKSDLIFWFHVRTLVMYCLNSSYVLLELYLCTVRTLFMYCLNSRYTVWTLFVYCLDSSSYS